MIMEALFAAYVAEFLRSLYHHFKESQRIKRLDTQYYRILRDSKTLEELARNFTQDRLTNPELYKRVPQTWMVRSINKMIKE